MGWISFRSRVIEYLDAPVRRVASLDTLGRLPPDLEDHILPRTEDIEREADRLLLH